MDVRLLGPVEATVDGRPVPLGDAKPRAVLAMLALNPSTTVSTDRLIDGLWGSEPPATAAKTLQVYVSRLRRALTANGDGDGADIVTRAHGYELRLAPDHVDTCRFERLLAHGARGRRWRSGAGRRWMTSPAAVRRRRDPPARRVAARGDRARGRRGPGRWAAPVPGRRARGPGHRAPAARAVPRAAVLALYRSGRQAAALAVYRLARVTLVEQIGVEPGPELRDLHEAILRQDPSLALEDEAALRPALDSGDRAVACPFKELASFDVDDAEVFFGRERLVSEIVARAVVAPVIGVIGPSGSGKSSVLRAGLLASLRGGALPGSERWSIALLRPGERPLEPIERAGGAASEDQRLVLAVDQFEEVFTACWRRGRAGGVHRRARRMLARGTPTSARARRAAGRLLRARREPAEDAQIAIESTGGSYSAG
jgi:Novel STAND NTPase 1/Bacterial transcriptional activator domain